METLNTQSLEMQSTGSTPSIAGKKDPAWEHFSKSQAPSGKVVFTCLYCGNSYKGGGIYRMKYHLAGIQGQISSCRKVPPSVRVKMQDYLNETAKKKKKATMAYKQPYNDDDPFKVESEKEEVQEMNPSKKRVTQLQEKGKRKQSPRIDNYFSPTSLSTRPSIKGALAGQEAINEAHMAIARWFFDACIPFSALNSPYYQLACNAIAPGFKGPSYHDMRGKLLRACKKEFDLLIDSYRNNWTNSGCTIMVDDLSDQKQRTLINFLVYCPLGLAFVKSVDASNAIKDATKLFNLFSEIVEWVGPSNVVHMVTDNTTNYAAAGRMLQEKYQSIYWSPCAARCVNLILKDISSMDHIANLVSRASKVTRFVYNHITLLTWLRKKSSWKEIVRPAVTHEATAFLAMKNIYENKHDLQALVTNNLFTAHQLLESIDGNVFSSTILDDKFWDECLIAVKITTPLIRLLLLVDSDAKPSLGYVYEGMRKARKAIKHMFLKRKEDYELYIKIIDKRWDKRLRCNLHTAAYFLNPAFIYGENFCKKLEVMDGLLDILETKAIFPESQKALKEIKLYRDRMESFSRQSALTSSKTMQPDEWWKLFGYSAPTLQKIAIRILSQTSSAFGCERNWDFFERMHMKKRNRVEHQRQNDLVFVRYNLRLKNRLHYKKVNFDPIDYEVFNKTQLWIEDDDPNPVLDFEDSDKALYRDYVTPTIGNSNGSNTQDTREEGDCKCENNNLESCGSAGASNYCHNNVDENDSVAHIAPLILGLRGESDDVDDESLP